jgi:hypothetical protein
MADQNNADEMVFTLLTQPGIKRDGTTLEGEQCSDGQWVRFQRGKAKKMGGYRRITDALTGPVRKFLLWSRKDLNSCISFSSSEVETLLVDNNLVGNAVNNRTPTSGFTSNANNMWTADTQYDDAVGTTGTIILAHCNQSLANIDDDTATKPFWALASSATSLFATITDAPAVSGGIFSLAPYTVVYGSDGFVGWSDVNQPQVWSGSTTPGDAGSDRVTGAKVVAGLPFRSGALSAILWSLDSVLRMDYVGGSSIFKFSTLSAQSSILAQNSVIEYDGMYFWIGVDRFMAFDTAVRELPNDMNQNYFFDNLNYTHRQKIWATKIPRFGEIWWFYPRGDATECSHAIIFNVRLKTWYDVELARSAGFYSQIRQYPTMVGSAVEEGTPIDYAGQNWTRVTVVATVTTIGHGFTSGDTINVSVSSDTSAIVVGTKTVTVLTADTFTFPCLNAGGASGTLTYDKINQTYGLYQHEFGKNATVGDVEAAIPSYYVTQNFGYLTGGVQDSQQGPNRWTRLTRVEPDFVQEGDMTCSVLGYEFAQAPAEPETSYNFTASTGKIDMRVQRRHILLKFESNTLNGSYEAGKVIIHTELGDNRS